MATRVTGQAQLEEDSPLEGDAGAAIRIVGRSGRRTRSGRRSTASTTPARPTSWPAQRARAARATTALAPFTSHTTTVCFDAGLAAGGRVLGSAVRLVVLRPAQVSRTELAPYSAPALASSPCGPAG